MNGQDAVLMIGLLALFAVGFIFCARIEYGDGEHNLDWHRRKGQWQVRYSDGRLSQPFTRKVAEEYAEMFDGVVIPKETDDPARSDGSR